MRHHPERVATSERGASSAEYALLIALIAAVIVGALLAFGDSVADLFAFSLPED